MNKLNVSNVGKMVGKRESFMYIVKVTFSIKFPFLWLIIFLDKLHQLIYYKCIYHQTENEKKKKLFLSRMEESGPQCKYIYLLRDFI